MNRRQFLAALGAGGLGVLLELIPSSRQTARLDVDIEVTDWEIVDEEVVAVTARLTNNEDGAIHPVAMPWGHGSNPQVHWPIERGPPRLAPGQQAEYVFDGSDGTLQADERAVMIIYDEATEQRAYQSFVPVETPSS